MGWYELENPKVSKTSVNHCKTEAHLIIHSNYFSIFRCDKSRIVYIGLLEVRHIFIFLDAIEYNKLQKQVEIIVAAMIYPLHHL